MGNSLAHAVAHFKTRHMKLTELIEVRISTGDIRVELVVIANREYRSVHLPQLVDILLRYVTKSDVSPACCFAAFAHLHTDRCRVG